MFKLLDNCDVKKQLKYEINRPDVVVIADPNRELEKPLLSTIVNEDSVEEGCSIAVHHSRKEQGI